MIEQVGGFTGEVLIFARYSRECGLEAFLADFLRDATDAFEREADRVARLVFALDALGEKLVEVPEETHARGAFVTKATWRAAVAGRSDRVGFDQQGVIVTIDFDADDLEEISRALAFRPQALFGTAEERDGFGALGFLEGVCVHVAEHQHLLRGRILHDGGDKSVGFLPVDFQGLHRE